MKYPSFSFAASVPALALSLAIGLGLLLPANASAEDYTIDGAHSVAEFKIRHMMVSWVRGALSGVSGTVSIDPKKPEATKAVVEIPVSTVQTYNAKRDKHLLEEDFFYAEKFPTLRFESTRVQEIRPGAFDLVGQLTLRGVTREVTVAVEGPSPEVKGRRGGFKSGASARFVIKRSDFGMTYSKLMEGGGLVVGDEVHIIVELELNRREG